MFKFNVKERLSRDFKPQFFNTSEIETLLKNNEEKVIINVRTKESKAAYDTFDADYSAYLNKLPASNMKKYVSELFNRRLVFIGVNQNKDLTTFSRILITKTDKVAGIVLNGYSLDISPEKGTTPQIDNCIFATYVGLIRAALIINRQEVKRDFEFHKIITSYLYILLLKTLSRQISVSASNQKSLLHIITVYLFYRQFMQEKHSRAIHYLEKYYVGDLIDKMDYEAYKSDVERLEPYISFKDLPRIFQDYGLASNNHQQIMMHIIKTFDRIGYYALIGSLDNLVSSFIISGYPTDIVPGSFSANKDLHEKLEKGIEKYINKLSFDRQFIDQEIYGGK